jgi:hypothetical protein
MTEAEWLACRDPDAMLEFLKDKASDRKLRFASGQFCHSYVAQFSAEDIIWGELEWHILLCATEASELGCRPEEGSYEPEDESLLSSLLRANAYTAARGTWSALVNKIHSTFYILDNHKADPWERMEAESATFNVAQCALLRELFGNPFRQIVIEPTWCTSTVVSLAREMYDAHHFSALPILADALQDAGCDNVDVLIHCRDTTAKHVRGCWVVDQILEFAESGPRPPRPATEFFCIQHVTSHHYG